MVLIVIGLILVSVSCAFITFVALKGAVEIQQEYEDLVNEIESRGYGQTYLSEDTYRSVVIWKESK